MVNLKMKFKYVMERVWRRDGAVWNENHYKIIMCWVKVLTQILGELVNTDGNG